MSEYTVIYDCGCCDEEFQGLISFRNHVYDQNCYHDVESAVDDATVYKRETDGDDE